MTGTRTLTRAACIAASAVLGASASVLLTATPSSAMAVVLHPADQPDCTFEPGDVPGVDEYFPATCTTVFTSSGQTVIVGTGWLPEGYTLDRAIVTTAPCFGGTGQIVAATSGRVSITCHL